MGVPKNSSRSVFYSNDPLMSRYLASFNSTWIMIGDSITDSRSGRKRRTYDTIDKKMARESYETIDVVTSLRDLLFVIGVYGYFSFWVSVSPLMFSKANAIVNAVEQAITHYSLTPNVCMPSESCLSLL